MSQKKISEVWEQHIKAEFETKSVDDTMATMIEGAYVNNVPVMTGGVGLTAVREFYARSFIAGLPPDTEIILISRTIGTDQVVDETIFKFTHSIVMDWMLPGLQPTGKRIEIAIAAIVGFREGKVSHEHIYWDQASVLVQLGLIDERKLPVKGSASARQLEHLSSLKR